MRPIKLSLTKKGSFDDAIEALENYKVELREKSETFVSLLIERGIEIAKINTGPYAGMISFQKVLNRTDEGCDGVLIATDGKKLVREWYTDKSRKHKRSYEVSPLLLAEFGSGWLADVTWNVPGVGQGTMPNSYGHAADDDGWWWYDEDGVKHHSIGETPQYPMRTALLEMMFDVDKIGKEVFGNGK